jgi:DNA-binding GntR family transcriptional regulator
MIVRERFSTDVHQELLARIIRGEYAPGQRIKDTDLAEEYGVSRTPVREALLRLEREGFVSAQKHLGFSVKGLCESEIREVYPLVRLLECTALASVPLPDSAMLAELDRLCRSIDSLSRDPFQRIELDSAWHKLLIENNGNRHLNRILADLKGILFRYEYAFMQKDEFVAQSVAEHRGIARALGEKRRRRAVELLGEHWERCTLATLNLHRTMLENPGLRMAEGARAIADEAPGT